MVVPFILGLEFVQRSLRYGLHDFLARIGGILTEGFHSSEGVVDTMPPILRWPRKVVTLGLKLYLECLMNFS